jgi:hypothetical protein
MISGEQIEKEIEDKGLTAPRVTMADIGEQIASEHFFTAAQGDQQAQEDNFAGNSVQILGSPLYRLTFCALVLKNGYIVTGESACVSPENFDAELGRKIAKQNALDKCWPLFGFHLAAKLYESLE